MITKQQYVEYLLSTPINYTCTNMADHLDGVSHDVVSDYLGRDQQTSRHLWELVQGLLDDRPEAWVLLDDRVQNKQYARAIEMVKLPYSGAVGGLGRGIGVVNLIHTTGSNGTPYPLEFRIYAQEADGQTKNDHLREMLLRAVGERQIQATGVLFDSWYASGKNLKLGHRLGLVFYTTLKNNRLISWRTASGYVHLDEIAWSAARLKHGLIVKLKKVPFTGKLFKVVAPPGASDWVITNELDEPVTTPVAPEAPDWGWQVEEFHRALKQLTGSEKCPCRQARAPRNHLACGYHAWLSLQVHAQALKKTIYQARPALFSDYLRAELRNPRIPAFQPV